MIYYFPFFFTQRKVNSRHREIISNSDKLKIIQPKRITMIDDAGLIDSYCVFPPALEQPVVYFCSRTFKYEGTATSRI